MLTETSIPMLKEQVKNRRRIIEMAFKSGGTHLGSALSTVDIIEAVYRIKLPNEKFVLSSGHAASALYTVLESHGYITNPDINKLGVHPNRKANIAIDVSSGSWGYGLPIAIGLAIANRQRRVFCCISDGECSEGSIFESLRIGSENNLVNLITILNANGYAGYKEINVTKLPQQFKGFGWAVKQVDGHNINALKQALSKKRDKPTIIMAKTKVGQLPFLKGLDAHYHKMNEEEYKLAIKIWSET